MEPIFTEEMIREELKRLDLKTGLQGAELPIKFGMARCTLGKFSYEDKDNLFFYFSNYYFLNPNHPIEEKIETIRHEYAHYMDYVLHGLSSHGVLWKQCCKIVGASPTRCFSQPRADWYMLKHKIESELIERYDAYKPGLIIIHPSFGQGEIIEVSGDKLSRLATVSFNKDMVKTLSIKWIDANCKIY